MYIKDKYFKLYKKRHNSSIQTNKGFQRIRNGVRITVRIESINVAHLMPITIII